MYLNLGSSPHGNGQAGTRFEQEGEIRDENAERTPTRCEDPKGSQVWFPRAFFYHDCCTTTIAKMYMSLKLGGTGVTGCR